MRNAALGGVGLGSFVAGSAGRACAKPEQLGDAGTELVRSEFIRPEFGNAKFAG